MKKSVIFLALGVACATAYADTGVASTATTSPAPVFVSDGQLCQLAGLIALTETRSTASCIDGKWREDRRLSKAELPTVNGIFMGASTFAAGKANIELSAWRRVDGHICRQYAKGVSYAPDGAVTRIDTAVWCDDDKPQQSAQN
ncbi:hypothetical protein [Paraburkholderia youngii]|uniref:hypothetical protein n=1 Tax=Paraburkholderia youngii TaxID=2782701 RepID=UPI003D22A4B4